MTANALEILEGIKLTAIVFVMDYLQVQFEGGVITFLELPEVSLGDETCKFGDRDYRNTLCEFIGEVVLSVDHKQDMLFGLYFENGSIQISISPEHDNSREMVVVNLADKCIVF